MSRWIIIAVVVVCLTAVATFVIQSGPSTENTETSRAVAERKGPQPKVEIAGEVVHDFGTMSQESKGSHDWEIKNVGEGTLELWLRQTTCVCTLANLHKLPDKVTVEPGNSFKINLNWDTQHKPNPYSQGATIGTNDPKLPEFNIGVKGDVYPPVEVFPPDITTLNGISNEEVTTARIAVVSKDRPALQIKGLTTSRPAQIVAKQEPLTDEERSQLRTKGGHRVTVEVRPGMPLGAFKEELVIETDHPLRPLVKVTIAGRATGPIIVLPERLLIRGMTSVEGGSQDLTLLVRGGRATKFDVVKEPKGVKVDISPNDTATLKGRYRLRATVPAGTPAGEIRGDIELKTDHPKATEVKIPVTILISSAVPG